MTRPRVLVVEDNAMNRMLVREILSHAGFEVLEAEDVGSGRARLSEVIPDAVVMDIQLPGGGGESLLQEMRAAPRLADVPVIAVTAFAMNGDRERFLESGFDAYVSKPIDTRTFADGVRAAIERRAPGHVA
ncbi:MAG: response regulator [Myxococcota bacterium]